MILLLFPWSRRGELYPYPTSASFLSQAILGAGLGLLGVTGGVWVSGAELPLFWLLVPAGLALLAAWAVGPGMREELRVGEEERAVLRRVHTLGWPSEEVVLPDADLRMVALAVLPGPEEEEGGRGGAFCVAVDWRSRWLALSYHEDLEEARTDRRRVARTLGLPEVEYRCPTTWVPAWGRVQPPPPPPPAREADLTPQE